MKNKIIILMTIFSIMFITVAWASFSTTLMITGEGTILTDSTPPTCGAWKLRPSTLTYAEATAQDAFINPGTNTTWRNATLILSVDCTDNLQCAFDHYDVKTYNTTTKTDSNALTQVIQDAFSNQTTCTLPLGASNPYVDKDAPEVHLLNLFPEDGEFKVTVGIRDVKLFSSFQNTDGAYYTYEGKSFIGTGVNNLIISENIISEAKYASAYGTDNGDGTYTFADHPAADAAASYCTGCRLMTKDEAIAWDSAAGASTKRIGNYNSSASNWWLADAYNIYRALHVSNTGSIIDRVVTFSCGVRPAVTIDSNMKMSGSGTQGDPYVIMPANSNYAESGIVSAQFYYKKCGDNNWTALTKNSFAATDTKVYNNWYIPSNSSTSTSCLSSAWGTYYFRVDVEDAVGNTKTYYSKKTTNSTNPVEGYTENENEMNQFALAPLKARNISYDNTGQPTLCTDVECAHDQLRYMFGLGLSYGITLDNRSATTAGTSVIYENYGDGFYLTNTSGTLSNKMTTSANAITVPTKSNNSFLGYYTETNGGGTQYIDANGNITANATASLKRSAKLYAKWRRTVFYIILDMESGTGGTEMIYVNYNDGFYLNNTDGVLSNKMTTSTNALTIPTRVGYTFGGYYTGQNGAGTQIIDSTGKITSSASSTQFNTDEVLYAKWEQAPGLFDASGNVVKTWSELEALGLTKSAIETDYASSSAASADGTPYQILRSLSSNYNYNYKLVLPSTITKIGNYALHSSVTLSSITLPNTVTSIGDYSFDSSCISSINIPSSISSIGEYAFSYSDITDINIPGNGSTTIADNAFLGCPILKTVTIGSGVTDVGRWVFRACDKLTTVTIEGNSNPNTPTNLGACAVSRNPALTAINFGTGAITIGQQAFVYNTSLKSIVIGRGVTSFSNTVFDNTDLTSISVDPNNPIFDSRNNCNAIIETSTNTLIYGFTTTTIPSTVTTIGKTAFAGINITSITIPNGVTTIDDSAFVRSGLTSITIPASVTFIGQSAFSKTSLTSVTFVTTSTWKAVPTRNSTSGKTLTVTDPANNATLLKSTYASRYIKRF